MTPMRHVLTRVARSGVRVQATYALRLHAAVEADALSRRSAVGTAWVRSYGSHGINGSGINGSRRDEDADSDNLPHVNGDLSPFERLLQHSQQFCEDLGLEEEEPEHEQDDDHDGEDIGGGQDDDRTDRETREPEGNDGARGTQAEHAAQDLQVELDAREEDHAEFVSMLRKPRAEQHRDTSARRPLARGSLSARVRRQLLSTPEIDFEHGLSALDERRSREKMYLRLLRRDYDRDRVCQNCGEPGHVARNCMLPTICSNCGEIGHRQFECRHDAYTPDDVARAERMRRAKQPTRDDPEERRRIELHAIKDRHQRMKKAFDDEIDEYLDRYESMKARRKDRRASQSEETLSDTSEDRVH